MTRPAIEHVAWIVLAGACAGCDTVRDHYDTLEEARADRLFERGWLPDVLPDSAVDIHTANDLDIGRSRGRFDYRVGDDAAMVAAMRPGAPAQAPFDDWTYIVATQRADGLLPWTFHDDDATWVFFCDRGAGHCETWLWSGHSR
jgi:hypothetical protein